MVSNVTHLQGHPPAFLKNTVVCDMLTFNQCDDIELINVLIRAHSADEAVSLCGYAFNDKYTVAVGYTYEGGRFWSPQPYPSWTKDSEYPIWNAPKPVPADKTKLWEWDETKLDWIATPGITLVKQEDGSYVIPIEQHD